MRKLLALLLFTLLTTTANAQFRLASDGPVFNTSVVNDSTFIVDVNIFADLTGSGYIPTNIIVGYRMFSQRGQLYRINAIANATFSSATFTIIEVDNAQVNTEGLPIGQVQVYDPGTVEAIPQVPFGTTGATAVLQAAVVSYNSILPGGSESVVDLALVRGIVNDSLSVLRPEIDADIFLSTRDSVLSTTGASAIRVGLSSPTTLVADRLYEVELDGRGMLSIENREGVNGFTRTQNVVFNPAVNGIEGSESNWVAGGSTGAGNWIYGTLSLNRLNAIYGGYFDTITNSLASSLVHTMRSSMTESTHASILSGSRNRMNLADYSVITGGADNYLNAADYNFIGSGNLNTVTGPYNFLGTPISATVNGNGSSVLNGDVIDVNGNFNVVGRGVSSSVTGGSNYLGVGSSTNITGESNYLSWAHDTEVNGNYNYGDVTYSSNTTGPLSKISGIGVSGRFGGHARASGYFDEIGDAQVIKFVGSRSVVPASTGDLRMTINPFAPTSIFERIQMRDSTVVTLVSQVTARNQTGTKSAGYVVKAVVQKLAGIITVKTYSTEAIFEDVPGWDVRIEKIDNASIYIRVYGDPTDTTRWFAETTLTELKWN